MDDHRTPWQTSSNLNVGKAADGRETEEVAAAKLKNPKTDKGHWSWSYCLNENNILKNFIYPFT